MDNIAIIDLWKAYDKKLEENIVLNKKNAAAILHIKTRSLLASMNPVKIFTVAVGVLWVTIGTVILSRLFIYAFSKISIFFFVSASLQILLTVIAIFIYLYQLVLINNTNINEPVLATQKKLASLKTSSLLVARILFLQLPLWTTFYLSEKMFADGNILLLLLQFIITGAFTYIAVWLFIHIKFENRNKRWFRFIFDGKEWEPVLKSMELLEQVEGYSENRY